MQWDPGTTCNCHWLRTPSWGWRVIPSCLQLLNGTLRVSGCRAPGLAFPCEKIQVSHKRQHGCGTKHSAKGAPEAKERGTGETPCIHVANRMLKVEPAISSCRAFVHAVPSSWRALHSHPLVGIKTYESSNTLSSVKCSDRPGQT